MRCPVCVEESLVISSREGIEIDHCPQCRGVWLDRGELDKIIDRAAPAVVGARSDERARDRDDRGRDRARDDRDRYDDRGRDDRYRDDRDRYDDRSRDGDRKPRKKRSFLEDIFDFD